MTKFTTKSSALVITTLGVYLGLLIVGGAVPQVFAHSATTRNFDISEELELHDDLDNNPDDVERASASLKSYFDDLESFLNSIEDRGGEDRAEPLDVLRGIQFVHLAGNCFDLRSDDLYASLRRATRKASPKVANHTASIPGMVAVRFEREPAAPADSATLPNSEVLTAKDQNFVVTRLPRAGLNALLSNDAK